MNSGHAQCLLCLLTWHYTVNNKMTLDSKSTELLPLDHSSSIMWKFFDFQSWNKIIIELDNEDELYCKVCQRDYPYVGIMSNVWHLLEESYIEEYCKAKEEAQEYTQIRTIQKLLIRKSWTWISTCNKHSCKFYKHRILIQRPQHSEKLSLNWSDTS